MNRKSVLAAIAATSALALGLTGCSGGGNEGGNAEGGGGSLEVFMNMPTGSPQESMMNELVAEFEDQTGAAIDISYVSGTYEDEMKVKMASDSVPDVFITHGWSVNRYSPFLRPLNDQPWVEYVNPGLDNVMFDDEGNIYALPLEYGTTGLIVNYDVLEQVGVNAEDFKSWDDVEDAMQKMKDELGIHPFTSSAKDTNAGNIANFIASGAFTEEQNAIFRDQEFDKELWQEGVTDRIQSWQEKGFFNPDYTSATVDDMARQLADGTAAFALEWTSTLSTAYEYNPDANLGFVPIPGVDGEYLVGGEGINAFGVSKTAKDEDLALEFLNFVAEPENAQRLLESLGAYSGLTNVDIDLGTIQPSFDKYVAPGDIPTMPFFDRVYLPNGMWDTIVTTTDGVINGQMTSEVAAQQMADQYQTLRSQ